jgi:hypothetical protein
MNGNGNGNGAYTTQIRKLLGRRKHSQCRICHCKTPPGVFICPLCVLSGS